MSRQNLLDQLRAKYATGVPDSPEGRLSERMMKAARAMPPSVLDNVMKQLTETLPNAEKRYGKDHPNYLFYIDVLMCCIWCQRYMTIVEDMQLRMYNLKIMNSVLQEQLVQAQKDLDRYTTAEDLLCTGTIDWYMRQVLENISQAVPDHPRVKAFAAALDLLTPDKTTQPQPFNNIEI